ncbi:MAG: hypothetical protein J6V06_02135 [Clostridia bacterium]|nr:hypothetical protein [Clostridia bacterium]
MYNTDNNPIEEVNIDIPEKKEPQKNIFPVAVKGIALIIGLFILGNIIGSLTNVQYENTLQTDSSTTLPTVSDTTLPATTLPSATQPTTEETTTEVTTTLTTTEPTTKDVTPDTKKEIVELFNSSINKVKPNAKKVTRNYVDRREDENVSDYPRVLRLAGLRVMNSWLVKYDIPVEYTDKELIQANFPVEGQTWSSKLTADDVGEAICSEKDGQYEIHLKLLYCKDPEKYTGVCSVMEEVNLGKVQELVDIVKTCSTEYYDCEIICTVDKNSGNLTYIKYIQPMALTMTTQRLTQMNAVFGMTFESEYVIEY